MRRFVVFNPGTSEPLRIRGEGLQFMDGSAMVRWVTPAEDAPEALLSEISGQQSSGWAFAPNTLEQKLATWNTYALFLDRDEIDLSALSDPRAHEEAAAELASKLLEEDVDRLVRSAGVHEP